jgi:hypothetical protein
MHFHDEDTYVNTLDAALCAMERIERLSADEEINNKVVVVAHDQQLWRALWNLKKVRAAKETLKGIEFVVPDIPDSPYPSHSLHWQTRNETIYQIVELFGSRVRDCFSSVPTFCRSHCPLPK